MSGIEKPTQQEDEYFALEEIEQKRRIAMKQSEETAANEKAQLRNLHHMKCPNCGMDLHALNRGDVEVDTCFNCKGTWLNAGQLEELVRRGAKHSGAVIEAILNIVHIARK